MNAPIYLDYNATTPVDARVADVVSACLRETFGNPSSAHSYGADARELLEHARAQVAALLECEPQQVLFTSCGTESNNLALLGVCAGSSCGRHLVTSNVEHPAIEQAARHWEQRGGSVTRVPVEADGRVDASRVREALQADTALVSVMHANNETGALQPIAEIARACRKRGVPFHSDAAQSVGKLPTRVDELGVDLLTVAGHKLYAPKGVGALYVREGLQLAPISFGGGQERGLRPGTENVALAAGLGMACELARRELGEREEHMRAMRDRLHARLLEGLGAEHQPVLNGPRDERLPNTLNISVPGIRSRELLTRLEGVATSAGSACHEGRDTPSPILTAMGIERERALCALRLSVGATTTAQEIDEAASQLIAAI